MNRIYTIEDFQVGQVKNDILVRESYFQDMRPTRKDIVEDYLSSLGVLEQHTANTISKELQRDDLPMADTAVLIPIAAHQEAPNIENALDQYALQQSRRPFSVMLYPNAPNDDDLPAIQHTLDQIEIAKQKHPHLDIRSTPADIYHFGSSIGTIRRSLWNAALLLAHYEGRFDNPHAEVTGFNHDIDLVNLSPRYIDRVQAKVDNIQRRYEDLKVGSTVSRPHSTFLKHAHDPSRPNVAKAVFWHDFSYWQVRPRGAFDAGLVIPFSLYADRSGIPAGAKLNEMAPLTKSKDVYVIPGTVLETSPRRFAERLQSHNLDGIWQGEDSFGANDAYRADTSIPDISPLQLESALVNSLDHMMEYFTHRAIAEYSNDTSTNPMKATLQENMASLVSKLERRKRLAITVLERYIELPAVARLVESTYDITKIASEIVKD